MSADVRKAAYEKYRFEFSRFEAASVKIKGLLDEACRTAGLRGEIQVRPKTLASFIKKIYAKPYSDPWEQTTDKVGGRIIVETLVDLEKVTALFRSIELPPFLEVLSIEDKSDAADPKNLYYPGIHVQAVVPDILTTDGQRIECEIQLRTKAQDAWSVAAHGRIYKGIISPSHRTARRLYRLSVLTEMFDEEVMTAMDEIHSELGYENAVLLQAAESLYLPMAGEPGEDALSMDVLDLMKEVLSQGDQKDYISKLSEFVKLNSDKIQKILDDFGPHSSFADQWAYWLFSQPESLVIFERVENCSLALAEAVQGSEMEDAFRHLYEAWGESFVSLEEI